MKEGFARLKGMELSVKEGFVRRKGMEVMVKRQGKTWVDYLFCLVVGSIYIFALNRTVVTSTLIVVEPLSLYFIGILSMVIFFVILFNKVTRITTIVILALIAFYMLFTLDDFSEQYPHLYDMWLMVRGYIFRQELGRTAVWLISLMLGFTVVIFMFYQFNFFVLAIGGVAIFLFSWVPGFTRDEISFLFFLVSFCLLLIRRMNKSSAVVLLATPLCVALVIFAHVWLPDESEMYVQRGLRDTFDGRFTFVEDMLFEFFNPMYFSFQSTGFAGAGGRLGGPVTLNHRPVMTVNGPGRVYLSGAVSETYTGSSWVSVLQPGDVYTHGITPGHFEMLETAAALIREASVVLTFPYFEQRAFLVSSGQDEEFEHLFPLRLEPEDNFHALGVANPVFGRTYIHTYLPFDMLTVNIGSQRTGTIFRPGRMYDMIFLSEGQDYLAVVDVSPTGDFRAPGFMARDTTYHIWFMNIDSEVAFVQEILQGSGEGVYASRNNGLSQITILGEAFGLYSDEIFHEVGYNTATFLQLVHMDRMSLVYWLEHAGFILDEDDDLSMHVDGDYFVVNDDYIHLIDLARAFAPVMGFGWNASIVINDSDNFSVDNMMHLLSLFEPAVEAGWYTEFIRDEMQLLEWLDSFSTGVLADYAAQVRANFLDVPEIVPQRVWDLTQEIVADFDTDFERIMAIRDYLLGFPYTLEPIPVPRGVCFVDHFLFVGREGYCTYFASAMAVMSRIAGVPSRYVEGFILPPGDMPEEGVAVTNRMAHAWAEVYFEGFGWIVVEATPAYVTNFPSNWQSWAGSDWVSESDAMGAGEMWRMDGEGFWEPGDEWL